MFLYEGIREDEPEESPAFENLMVNIFCFCLLVAAIYFFCKIMDMISEYRQKSGMKHEIKTTKQSDVQPKQDANPHPCGTVMRKATNNAPGWKDKTGHVLTNGEVDLLRKYYFVYMTPVIHEMFDDEWAIKNDFEYIASRSVFPQKPLAESDFEVYFYYNMMMPIVQSLIPKHFTSDRGFTEKELFDIADDILGEQDHDFNYLSRTYGMRRW